MLRISKKKLVAVIVLLALLTALGVIYITGGLAPFICKPGSASARGASGRFCYEITGKDGEMCQRSNDCNGGTCVLDEKSKQGVCKDVVFGCITVLDGIDTNDDTAKVICVD